MKSLNLKLTFLVLLSSSLLACSSDPEFAGSLDSSSRLQDTSTQKPLAYCNEFKNDSDDIRAKAYSDSAGNIRQDLMLFKAITLPSTFPQDTSYLSFFKWKAASTTAPYLNTTALKFALYDSASDQYLTQWLTSMRWRDISALAASKGTPHPQDFFKNVQILVNLEDSAGEYDAIRIVEYHYQTNKAQTQIDGLLPLFHANPTDYAVEADGTQRALALQKIHPFKDLKGQRSATEFSSMANAFCF